jgi:uncharacterized membrane protein (DUF4010 family)
MNMLDARPSPNIGTTCNAYAHYCVCASAPDLLSSGRVNIELETLLSRVALACGLGLLIGLERGWRTRDAAPGSRTAGIRTFAISGLLGGIVGALARDPAGGLGVAGSLLIGLSFVAFAVVFMRFERDENIAAHRFSATTTIAGLLTFMLGVYALLGDVNVAAAAAVAATGVLIVREDLHAWVKKITLAELQSVLVLLAMTLIALPIVPDRAIGPFGGVNPRQIWIIAIVLASISFAGFIAIRALGERRGVLVAGALGGIVSSTAVIFANARAAAAGNGTARVLAAGTALASAVSFMRVIAIVAVLNPALLSTAAPPLLVAALAAVAFCAVAIRWPSGAPGSQSPTEFRNPFGFFSVVGMALSMGIIMLGGRMLSEEFGASGAFTTAALTGIFDVDAMTVSMTQLAPRILDIGNAANAIRVGVASATLGKAAIGAILGGGRFAVAIACLSTVCVAAGALAFFGIAALR